MQEKAGDVGIAGGNREQETVITMAKEGYWQPAGYVWYVIP